MTSATGGSTISSSRRSRPPNPAFAIRAASAASARARRRRGLRRVRASPRGARRPEARGAQGALRLDRRHVRPGSLRPRRDGPAPPLVVPQPPARLDAELTELELPIHRSGTRELVLRRATLEEMSRGGRTGATILHRAKGCPRNFTGFCWRASCLARGAWW